MTWGETEYTQAKGNQRPVDKKVDTFLKQRVVSFGLRAFGFAQRQLRRWAAIVTCERQIIVTKLACEVFYFVDTYHSKDDCR